MMTELNVSFKLSTGLEVIAKFTDNINILFDDSGTGKTYLIGLLQGYCYENNINVCFFDSNASDYTEESIILNLKGRDMVLFDNGDLYLTDKILNYCRENNILVIVSLKNIVRLNTLDAGLYVVKYGNGVLRTARCRQRFLGYP